MPGTRIHQSKSPGFLNHSRKFRVHVHQKYRPWIQDQRPYYVCEHLSHHGLAEGVIEVQDRRVGRDRKLGCIRMRNHNLGAQVLRTPVSFQVPPSNSDQTGGIFHADHLAERKRGGNQQDLSLTGSEIHEDESVEGRGNSIKNRGQKIFADGVVHDAVNRVRTGNVQVDGGNGSRRLDPAAKVEEAIACVYQQRRSHSVEPGRPYGRSDSVEYHGNESLSQNLTKTLATETSPTQGLRASVFSHRTITSLLELERARTVHPLSSWGDVLKRDARNTFFQGPVWTGEWYRAYSETVDPLVVVVVADDELAGVVPLAVEKSTRRVAFAGDQMADYRDILADPSARVPVIRSLLEVFRAGRFSNMLRIGPMLPESNSADLILSLTSELGVWGIRRNHLGWRWWVDDAEDPLKKKSVRYPLNYYRRSGDVQVEVLTRPAEWNALKEEFYNQHSLRQLYGARKVSFDNPMKRAFFEGLFATDLAHVTLLRVADRIIASHYGCVWDRVLYWGAPSFDVRESAYSPGLLLLALTMKNAESWGWRGVDLTIGEGNLKERFSTSKVDLPSVDLYARRIAWARQRSIDVAVRGMRRLTAHMGAADLWTSRIRPSLIAAGEVLRTALHLGLSRGIPWLVNKSLRGFWRTTTTTIYAATPADFRPAPNAAIDGRENQVYDLLRWDGNDPDTAARLTDAARKLPEAAKNDRTFHSLLIGDRLAAWGFSSSPNPTEGLPATSALRDFEALPEYIETGVLEALLGSVAAERLSGGAGRLMLHCTDPSRRAVTAFTSLGFRPVESVILTNKLGRQKQKLVRH